MKTKSIILILTLLLLSGVLFGQDGTYDAGDFIVDGEGFGARRSSTIKGFNNSGVSLSIPDKLGEFDVTSIANGAFRNKGLLAVTRFPSKIKSIGEYAFADNKLTTVDIPAGIEHIRTGTFRNNQLTSVTIRNGISGIQKEAFRQNRLTALTLPDSVQFVEENAFSGNQITKIRIGKNVNMETSSFENGFTSYYNRIGKEAGTYYYEEFNWLNEWEWKELMRMRQEAEDAARREAEARRLEEEAKKATNFTIGLELREKFTSQNEFMSNLITIRPFFSMDFGKSSRLNLSANFKFPWDEYNGWDDLLIEPDICSIYAGFDSGRLEMGRVYYKDPLGIITDGLLDGMKLNFGLFSVNIFYTGLLYKKTANIVMSREDLNDYVDTNNWFAPKRIVGSMDIKIGNYDTHLLLGGLGQVDMRDDPLSVNTLYAIGKLHLASNDLSFDIGGTAGFFKSGETPYKISVAASADLSYDFLEFIGYKIGVWWFSGNTGDNLTPFVPVMWNHNFNRWIWITTYDYNGVIDFSVYHPAFWALRAAFDYHFNDVVSLDFQGWYFIWDKTDDDMAGDKSDWKIDIGLTVKPAYSSKSSSSKSKSSGSGNVGFHLPFFAGVYFQGWGQNWFSVGFPLQLGFEIDFGNFMSIAALGELGGGVGLPALLEYNYGFMGELYFANKSFGFGYGYGGYGNLMDMLNEDTSGSSSKYMRFAIIIRQDNDSKVTLAVNKYDNGKWGGSVLFGWNVSSF